MGRIVFAAFTPHEGKERELMSVIADRLPLLRSKGLATEREHIVVRTADGRIIEISEWVDDDAIERAHNDSDVGELWKRFEACSDYATLDGLDELRGPFPTFDSVD